MLKKETKYGIQLPQMLTDFESIINDYVEKVQTGASLQKQYLSRIPR